MNGKDRSRTHKQGTSIYNHTLFSQNKTSSLSTYSSVTTILVELLVFYDLKFGYGLKVDYFIELILIVP